ncbi:MAG TPA: peptidoglycan-binding domain-containing protein [Clostridia bacterium]|nr:peptidoglycan-binding domain-containing protein [Clostridia bacterium]
MKKLIFKGCGTARQGSKGVYDLIAQDGLNTLGFSTGGLDGIFGKKTRDATIKYQQLKGLSPDGIIGCEVWRSLQQDVVGKGR